MEAGFHSAEEAPEIIMLNFQMQEETEMRAHAVDMCTLTSHVQPKDRNAEHVSARIISVDAAT